MKTTSWIAAVWILGFALTGCGPGGNPVPPDIATLAQSRPIGGETGLEADIRFDLGTIEITRETDLLYSLDLEYDRGRHEPRVEYVPGAKGRLSCRLENRGEGGSAGSTRTSCGSGWPTPSRSTCGWPPGWGKRASRFPASAWPASTWNRGWGR